MKTRGRRWLKKREFLIYYLIYKQYGCQRNININEVIELVMTKLLFNRKTSVNILKRLLKTGLLIRKNKLLISPKCLEDLLDEYLQDYINTRSKRLKKE